MDEVNDDNALEQALHGARALVLADLAASGVAEAEIVSLVEDAVSHRRWWVGQWPEGVGFVAGLVAQDVQDALLERYGRWPLCPVCATVEPHALEVEPELGADPHWVCAKEAVVVGPVGGLRGADGGPGGFGAGPAGGPGAGPDGGPGAGPGADFADGGGAL